MPDTDVEDRWPPGAHVVLRDVWRGRVFLAKPVTVVCDTPDLVALHLAVGTRWKRAQTLDGAPLRLPVAGWQACDAVWVGGDALYLIQPGAAHAVMAFWTEAPRTFRGWYLNLQEPLRRTPLGFDTMDQLLDVVVQPDRTAWAWKDEDELEAARRCGLLSDDACRAIRTEGQRAIAHMQAGAPPFCDGWETWQPDPTWPVPTLPVGWDADPTRG
jgi:predicted RNA-binding protein associated with RNAse of E/G family